MKIKKLLLFIILTVFGFSCLADEISDSLFKQIQSLNKSISSINARLNSSQINESKNQKTVKRQYKILSSSVLKNKRKLSKLEQLIELQHQQIKNNNLILSSQLKQNRALLLSNKNLLTSLKISNTFFKANLDQIDGNLLKAASGYQSIILNYPNSRYLKPSLIAIFSILKSQGDLVNACKIYTKYHNVLAKTKLNLNCHTKKKK